MEINKQKILRQYYKTYSKDKKKARNLIKKLDYKNDHFLLQLISDTYFFEGKLRLAERYIVKAFKINPRCPDVLWTLGLVRWDYGQIDAAIYCFKDIIGLRIKGIVKGGCKNDLDVAKAQINDSKFQLYRLYKKTKPAVAKRYLKMYEKGIAQGIFTLLSSYYEKETKIN